MAAPIIVGSFSYTLMGFVDQAMVARLGSDALAAIGSGGIWAFAVCTLFVGIASCISTFVSQSLGRGNLHDCGRYAWQGIYLSIVSGVLALPVWWLGEHLFALMNHSPEVRRLEEGYFNIRVAGLVFVTGQAALSAFFQAINRPNIPTIMSILSNVINVALNYALIYGNWGCPKLGVNGAAIATTIALAIQVIAMFAILLTPSFAKTYGTRAQWRFDLGRFRELFRIGGPNGLTFLMDILNWAIFTSFIIGSFGTAALAGHNAALAFMTISFMPALGLNHAIAPIVGQWIGRGDHDRAAARAITALKIAMVYMTIMGLFMAFMGKELLRIFFTTDPEVLRIGHLLLIMAAIFQAFDAINIVISGALRGAGDTKWMAFIFTGGAYLVLTPMALLFAFVFKGGAVGAWIGTSLYVIMLSGVLFMRFRNGKWRTITIFDADRKSEASETDLSPALNEE